MGKSVPYRRFYTTGTVGTRKRNAQMLNQFCEWLGKKPEDLRAEYVEARKSVDALDDWKRETKNTLLRFYTWLKEERKYKINYCRTATSSVMAFYSQNCERILGVTKSFDPIQIPENEFVFNQEILRKCYYYGSPFEKTWLSCAVSLGYSSQDFLELETEKIKNLVKQAKDEHLDFIGFIGHTRQKTSVQPRSFLTPEAISNLSDYLSTLKETPKTLWEKATNDNLNDWLKALLRKANIETYNRQVRFHGLRKFLYDTLSKKDETIAKVITAKKTSASDVTYKTSLDSECERIFRESYKEIALNGDVSGKVKREQAEKIESLESALVQLETENKNLRTRIEVLQSKLDSNESTMKKAIGDFEDRLVWLENKAKKKEKVPID